MSYQLMTPSAHDIFEFGGHLTEFPFDPALQFLEALIEAWYKPSPSVTEELVGILTPFMASSRSRSTVSISAACLVSSSHCPAGHSVGRQQLGRLGCRDRRTRHLILDFLTERHGALLGTD